MWGGAGCARLAGICEGPCATGVHTAPSRTPALQERAFAEAEAADRARLASRDAAEAADRTRREAAAAAERAEAEAEVARQAATEEAQELEVRGWGSDECTYTAKEAAG